MAVAYALPVRAVLFTAILNIPSLASPTRDLAVVEYVTWVASVLGTIPRDLAPQVGVAVRQVILQRLGINPAAMSHEIQAIKHAGADAGRIKIEFHFWLRASYGSEGAINVLKDMGSAPINTRTSFMGRLAEQVATTPELEHLDTAEWYARFLDFENKWNEEEIVNLPPLFNYEAARAEFLASITPITPIEFDEDQHAAAVTTVQEATTTVTTGTTTTTATTTTHAPCLSYFCAPGTRVGGNAATEYRDGRPPQAALTTADPGNDGSTTTHQAVTRAMPARASPLSTTNGGKEHDAVVITVAVICGLVLGCSSLVVLVGVITYRAYGCCCLVLPRLLRASGPHQNHVSAADVDPGEPSRDRPRSYRDAKKVSRVQPEASEDTSRRLRVAANRSDATKDLEVGLDRIPVKPPIVVVRPPSSTAPPELPVLLGGAGTASKEEV